MKISGSVWAVLSLLFLIALPKVLEVTFTFMINRPDQIEHSQTHGYKAISFGKDKETQEKNILQDHKIHHAVYVLLCFILGIALLIAGSKISQPVFGSALMIGSWLLIFWYGGRIEMFKCYLVANLIAQFIFAWIWLMLVVYLNFDRLKKPLHINY